MDQFSHDLTLALEETSLMDRACGVGRWGSRRRTRSTGNLPCAPQPTEDSSSSPTDHANAHGHAHGHSHTHTHTHTSANVDGLDTHNVKLPVSDSDEKAEGMLPLRLPCKMLNAAVRMGTGALESDSVNETNFSPARFYKPNSRRKRKIKRMSMEFEFTRDSSFAVSPHSFMDSPLQPGLLSEGQNIQSAATSFISSTGTVRKRVLKTDSGNRSNLFFCGKRKRSNRDRYHDHEHGATSTKLHSSSMPRYTHIEEYHRIRPRSFSFTSKPQSERLLPLNKGLLSKINRIAQQQKTENNTVSNEAQTKSSNTDTANEINRSNPAIRAINSSLCFESHNMPPVTDINVILCSPAKSQQPLEADYHGHRKNSHSSLSKGHRGRQMHCGSSISQTLHAQSMDCSDLCDFLSSSSLSSSSDSEDQRHDTDREGDDELTDWPGNEFGPGGKYDPKRKLTKKSLLPQIRSDDTIGEDDTLMSGTETTNASAIAIAGSPVNAHGGISQSPTLDSPADMPRFHPAASEPIKICGGGANRNVSFLHEMGCNMDGLIDLNICLDMENNINSMPPLKQIESEMSGETSNPFLSSSPVQVSDVREIRAGCRRINGDRPGFSIKLSVNERLARFLQDPRQTQIRLPDIEMYERDSLFNLATLYSLTMAMEHGCTVLTKTRNTTQSVNIDHHRGMPNHQNLFSDFKRRCYGDGDGASFLPQK